MKRDMDLIRKILLKMEEAPDSYEGREIVIEGHSQQEISFHLMLLDEAGLVKATDLSSTRDCNWLPERLTDVGYDFLAAARNEEAWQRTLQEIGDRVDSEPLSFVLQHLKGEKTKSVSSVAYLSRSDVMQSIAKTMDDLYRRNSAIASSALKSYETASQAARQAIAFSMPIVHVADFNRVIADLAESVISPNLAAVNEALKPANIAIGRLLELNRNIGVAAASDLYPIMSSEWREQISAIASLPNVIEPIEFALSSHLFNMSELSVLAQSIVADLDFGASADLLQLRDSLADLTGAYSGVMEHFGRHPSELAALPPYASRLPAVEYFNEASLLSSIAASGEPIPYHEKQRNIAQESIQLETRDRLSEQLFLVDKNLLALWQGAEEAVTSKNPDRARHAIISLRELTTHLLGTLAPDKEIEKWKSQESCPDYYTDKGRPTRKARLFFICRKMNHAPLDTFLIADIDAILKFIDLFNKGTHEVPTEIDAADLPLILTRAEGMFRFVLEIHLNG